MPLMEAGLTVLSSSSQTERTDTVFDVGRCEREKSDNASQAKPAERLLSL